MKWWTINVSGRAPKWDLLLGTALFLLSVAGGHAYVASQRTGDSDIRLAIYIFRPAIMLVGGRGFYEPDPEAFPEADAFLMGKIASLDPAAWPENIPPKQSAFTHASEYHLYLNYTVALFWRLFGLSRKSLEPLVVLMLGWTAVAAYGILRLGMGKVLAFALALAFTFSPPVLMLLPHVRNFSKAPFLLSIIFILGYLTWCCRRWKSLFVWSVILGVLHGVAMGFRQDALVFTPVAVLVLIAVAFLLHRRANNPSRLARIRLFAPVCLYLLLFLCFAWPMLGRMEGGADPYWPLVQGFSMRHMTNLGFGDASYMPLASPHDNYISSTLYHYYRRANNEPDAHFADHSATMQEAGRQWLLEMGMHFPADLLARGYASTLRILRYADALALDNRQPKNTFFRALDSGHRRFSMHMHYFGMLYAALALLLVSGFNLYLAMAVFVFSLYLCGYVSLQSELHHTFHLAFVPFWVVGFLASRAVHGGCALYAARKKKAVIQTVQEQHAALRRMLLFAACALLMTTLPLWTLRHYQRHTAKAVLFPVTQAERVPRDYAEQTRFGWTFFNIAPLETDQTTMPKTYEMDHEWENDVAALCETVALLLPRIPTYRRARYIIAEFDGRAAPEMLLLHYDSTHSFDNFSQVIWLPRIKNRQGAVYHAFPVYETVVDARGYDAYGRFEGIALPEAQAAAFKGFHEIVEPESWNLWMHFSWAEGDDFARPLLRADHARPPLHQRILPWPESLYYELAPHFFAYYEKAADRARIEKQDDTAALLYRLCLVMDTRSRKRVRLCRKLLALGDCETVRALAYEYLAQDQDSQETGALLLFEIVKQSIRDTSRTSPTNAHSEFAALVASGAENARTLALKAAALVAEHHDSRTGLPYYKRLVLAFPDCEAVTALVDDSLGADDNESAADFWQEIIKSQPDAVLPWLRLGAALEKAGRRAEAERVYATGLEHHPNHPNIGMAYLATASIPFDVDAIVELVNAIASGHPETALQLSHYAAAIAEEIQRRSDYPRAAKLFGAAANHAPLDLEYRRHQSRALIAALAGGVMDHVNAAALTHTPGQTAFSRRLLLETAESLADQGNHERAELLTRVAITLSPETPTPRLALGELLESRGAFHEALQLYVTSYIEASERNIFAVKIEALCNEAHLPHACVKAWRDILAALPGDADAWRRLGLLLEQQASWTEAETAYRAALTHDPENEAAELGLARVLLSLGSAEDAAAVIVELLEHDGDASLAAPLLIEAATELLEEDLLDEALPVCRLAVEHAPDEPFAWLRLGDAYAARDALEDAVPAWRQVVALAPDGPIAAKIARRLVSADIPAEERLVFWRDVLDTATEEVLVPELQYARALALTGQAMEALSRVKALAPRHPEDGPTQLALGVLLCRNGDFDQGLAQIKHAAARWPRLARQGARDLAAIAESLSEHRAQAALVEKLLYNACALMPDDPQYNALFGQALLAHGKPEEAIEQFVTVLMAAPESPQTAALMDDAYAALDAPEARQRTWEMILNVHPEAEVPRSRMRKGSQ